MPWSHFSSAIGVGHLPVSAHGRARTQALNKDVKVCLCHWPADPVGRGSAGINWYAGPVLLAVLEQLKLGLSVGDCRPESAHVGSWDGGAQAGWIGMLPKLTADKNLGAAGECPGIGQRLIWWRLAVPVSLPNRTPLAASAVAGLPAS